MAPDSPPVSTPFGVPGYVIAAASIVLAVITAAGSGLLVGEGAAGGAIFGLFMAGPGIMLALLVWCVTTGRHCFLIFLLATILVAVGQFFLAFFVLTGGGNAWGVVFAFVTLLTGVALAYFTILAFRARRVVRA